MQGSRVLPECSLTVRVRGELKHATVSHLDLLQKTAVRTIFCRERRHGDLISRFHTAAIRPAQSRSAKRFGTSQFESPLLYLAVGVLNIYGEVRMWIDPFHFRDGSADVDCFVNIELRLDGVVCGQSSRQSQSANCRSKYCSVDLETAHTSSLTVIRSRRSRNNFAANLDLARLDGTRLSRGRCLASSPQTADSQNKRGVAAGQAAAAATNYPEIPQKWSFCSARAFV